MATVTIVDKFPKATFTPDDIASERALRLSISGVISCSIASDAENWILTTVYSASPAAPPAARPPSPPTGGVQPPANTRFGSLVPGGSFSSDPFDHGVPRSIRTNNPGALNISNWQRTRPGFVGVTESDGSSSNNVTTIYRTPEHGVGSWFHLINNIYGFGAEGSFTAEQLARRYAGSASGSAVTGYLSGWSHFSGGKIVAATVISLASDADMLGLGKAMFGFEAGTTTPLKEEQITFAVAHERAGTLPA
jgi:hypothetical protein